MDRVRSTIPLLFRLHPCGAIPDLGFGLDPADDAAANTTARTADALGHVIVGMPAGRGLRPSSYYRCVALGAAGGQCACQSITGDDRGRAARVGP